MKNNKTPVVFKSSLFKNLANEIRLKGVMIPETDIEKIVELYIRVILSSNEGGFDNGKKFSVKFDPFATIDFDSLDDDVIHDISKLVIEICGTLEALNEKNPGAYTTINRETVGIITTGNNIATVFSEVQKMLHYLGAMAQDSFIRKDTVVGETGYWEFVSYDDNGCKFYITGVLMINGAQVFVVSYTGHVYD